MRHLQIEMLFTIIYFTVVVRSVEVHGTDSELGRF